MYSCSENAGHKLLEYLLNHLPIQATSSWDKTVRIWDVNKGVSCPMTGHVDVVWCVSYSPTNPNVVASVSRDSTTSLWDTRMGGRLGSHYIDCKL